MLVSIVIPCFQNQDQLNTTVERILNSTKEISNYDFELILIDDGSIDETWNIIQKITAQSEIVSGIRLKQNVGAYNAILTGFEKANGEAILIMAADGDDPPELIPELTNRYATKVDAVLAVRESSEKGLTSILASKFFHFTLKLTGAKNIFPGGSDYMLVSKEVIERCQAAGWKSGNTLIQLIQQAHRIQHIGYTKGRTRPSTWSFSKKLKLFLETVNQFVPLPGINSKPRQTEVSETC